VLRPSVETAVPRPGQFSGAVDIDAIAGTSIGALNGALLASDKVDLGTTFGRTSVCAVRCGRGGALSLSPRSL
jgi:hypothetical protein